MPLPCSHDQSLRFKGKPVNPDEHDRLMDETFRRLAPYYDCLLDVQTLGLHRYWRRVLVHAVAPHAGQLILDVAGGCGEMARRLTAPEREVIVLDSSLPMMEIGRSKGIANLAWVAGRSRALPFPAASMDIVVCAFGVRNVTYIEQSLKEVLRVLKPGALFFCLEASQPWRLLRPLHHFYCRFVVPRLGCWVTRMPEIYDYLVNSLIEFPAPDEIKRLFEKVGFVDAGYRALTFGVVCIHWGTKPVSGELLPKHPQKMAIDRCAQQFFMQPSA
jgi:demethylmenaquinone methyltransferase/2-methoxy-6-polyprenyl-1,4-benzoquinol methylase